MRHANSSHFPIQRLRVRCYCCRINIGRYTFKEAKFCLYLGKKKLVKLKCRQCAVRGIPFIDELGDSNMQAPGFELGQAGSQSQPGGSTNKLIYTEDSDKFS
jgi:hypothetical protein